jgi:hypothetical protein
MIHGDFTPFKTLNIPTVTKVYVDNLSTISILWYCDYLTYLVTVRLHAKAIVAWVVAEE